MSRTQLIDTVLACIPFTCALAMAPVVIRIGHAALALTLVILGGILTLLRLWPKTEEPTR